MPGLCILWQTHFTKSANQLPPVSRVLCSDQPQAPSPTQTHSSTTSYTFKDNSPIQISESLRRSPFPITASFQNSKTLLMDGKGSQGPCLLSESWPALFPGSFHADFHPCLTGEEDKKNLSCPLRVCLGSPRNQADKRQITERKGTHILFSINIFICMQSPLHKRNEDSQKWFGLKVY